VRSTAVFGIVTGTHTAPLLASGLFGAIVLAVADIVVRGGEGTTTVGAIVLVVGGGFLLWLVVANRAVERST